VYAHLKTQLSLKQLVGEKYYLFWIEIAKQVSLRGEKLTFEVKRNLFHHEEKQTLKQLSDEVITVNSRHAQFKIN
jgi:hypothetical protein